MTEYIQVDRDQLRVGMRFDYRASRDIIDGVERTLTNLDPIEYDYKTSFGFGHAKLTEEDTEGRKFYVHPDDLHVDEPVEVPTHNGKPIMSEETARANASKLHGERMYEAGVRDGYLKAQYEQQEGAAKPTSKATRRRFNREDALTWAIQALTGSHDGSVTDLIPLAQQIERYVNGNDEQEAKVEATEFPTVIETADQAALDWPEGTIVRDREGDKWERGDDSAYSDGKRDGWIYNDCVEAGYCRLDDFLPATVTRLGGRS